MNVLHNVAIAGIGLGLAAITPIAAVAANAYATTDVNERAGPGTDYPVVTLIPAGSTLTIFGCLSAVDWCDVAYAGTRGWVLGDYLQALYESERVPLRAYAPRLGVPTVTFNIVLYWNDYYRHRPFYRERARYARLHQEIVRAGPRGVIYAAKPQGPIDRVARDHQHVAGIRSGHVKKIAGPNRFRYATYGKASKSIAVKAHGKPALIRNKAHVKPAFVKGKGPRSVARKKPPRRCIVHGKRVC